MFCKEFNLYLKPEIALPKERHISIIIVGGKLIFL